MTIKKGIIGSFEIVYDNTSNKILMLNTTDSYKEKKEEETKKMLLRIEEFKARGAKVVKPKFINSWNRQVNKAFSKESEIWYQGVILEATLECMEKLSAGLPLDDVYESIDVQNPDMPSVYSAMELSGLQNYSISCFVGYYHERGEEFCWYRNSFVQQETEVQTRKQTIS